MKLEKLKEGNCMSEKAVVIDNLNYRYPKGTKNVLNGINLEIERGEFIVIMGPSGCGKSTLCLCLNGIIPFLFGGSLVGEVIIEGINTKKSSIPELSQKIGIVHQNPEMQLFTYSVEEEVAFGPENLALSRNEIERRIEESLKMVGLEGFEKRSPYRLSGGEKQRLVIASILALKPRILVLDEPSSSLDPLGILEISHVIRELNEKYGVTVIIVDHRIEWIVEYIDRIIVIKDGIIMLDGSPRDVFTERRKIDDIGLRPPQVTELAYELEDAQILLNPIPLTVEEAYKQISKLLRENYAKQ